MIIEPRMRGFICLTAHPDGAKQNVKEQIDYVTSQGEIDGPKKVLVIGASTGFGLASRITAAFGSNASTIGVFFEKPPTEGRTASPGWYNSAAFEIEAAAKGLYAKSVNGDAFSDEIKRQTMDMIKSDLGKVDLIIYSLASPVRVHPRTGVQHRSVLKPIGTSYTNKTVDFHTGRVSEISIEPSKDDDIDNTVLVMGGEDWAMWLDALKKENLLENGAVTVAYSYIGPAVTEPVYRKGTIGKAKDHLESTAFEITENLKSIDGHAYVSVNKALVTQASSAIPVIPLYISLLYKVMKKHDIHEGCIEQIYRLYSDKLYNGGKVATDSEGRIRIDDLEMRDDVQSEVARLWNEATSENLEKIGDLEGYRRDFYQLFGFDFKGVDYKADADEMLQVESIPQ